MRKQAWVLTPPIMIVSLPASCKQARSQVLITGASGPKSKTSNDAHGSDTEPQMKALVPANAITPANIRWTSQPAQAASLGTAGESGCNGDSESFREALLGLQEREQGQREPPDRITMVPQGLVHLRRSGTCGHAAPR
jgi:hypothetical protein